MRYHPTGLAYARKTLAIVSEGALIEGYYRFLTHQYQFGEAVLPLGLDRLCGVIGVIVGDRQTLIKSFSLYFFRLHCFCSVPLYL